jgi:hypothetical protein
VSDGYGEHTACEICLLVLLSVERQIHSDGYGERTDFEM